MPLPSSIRTLLSPILADPAASAILLDLDGTVAPIVPRPDDVVMHAGVRAALPRLRDRFALVAFVSGRRLSELDRIVATPGLALSGNHGAEIAGPDGRPIDGGAPDLTVLQAFARDWETPAGARGAWLEDKGATLTFHYRTAPDPAVAKRFLERDVMAAAQAHGLTAEPGRMSVEVRPAGGLTKGTATSALLDAYPRVTAVLSVGDDRTDVDVWRTLRNRVGSGHLAACVAIGVASDETPAVVRDSADALIDGVAQTADVLAFLAGHPPG